LATRSIDPPGRLYSFFASRPTRVSRSRNVVAREQYRPAIVQRGGQHRRGRNARRAG